VRLKIMVTNPSVLMIIVVPALQILKTQIKSVTMVTIVLWKVVMKKKINVMLKMLQMELLALWLKMDHRMEHVQTDSVVPVILIALENNAEMMDAEEVAGHVVLMRCVMDTLVRSNLLVYLLA
jgi:hypothetical protein